MNFAYDMEQLLELLGDFYSLTGIKIVVYDNRFSCIATVPEGECDFCTAIRKNPKGLEKCDSSALCAAKLCREKNALNIYNCHSGLIEAVAPIKINDVIVGYIMLGQLLEKKDKGTKKQSFLEYAAQFTDEDMSACFDRLTTKSYSQISSAAKLMESCVCYLLMREVIKEDTGNTAFKISRYIDENLSGDLSVDMLCQNLSISRNMLYRISESFFGMPIAKYIRKKRVERAEELIKSGVSVTRVSELCGFCDYTYFGKVFRSLTGVSPTKMRKANKKTVDNIN